MVRWYILGNVYNTGSVQKLISDESMEEGHRQNDSDIAELTAILHRATKPD